MFYFEEIKATPELVENFDQFIPEKWEEEPLKRLMKSNKIILTKPKSVFLEASAQVGEFKVEYLFQPKHSDPGPLYTDEFRAKSRINKFSPQIKFQGKLKDCSFLFSKDSFFNVDDDWVVTDGLTDDDFEDTSFNKDRLRDLTESLFEIYVDCGVENRTQIFIGDDECSPSVFIQVQAASMVTLIEQLQSNQFSHAIFRITLPTAEIVEAPVRLSPFGDLNDPIFVPELSDFEDQQDSSIRLVEKKGFDDTSESVEQTVEESEPRAETFFTTNNLLALIAILVFIQILVN